MPSWTQELDLAQSDMVRWIRRRERALSTRDLKGLGRQLVLHFQVVRSVRLFT